MPVLSLAFVQPTVPTEADAVAARQSSRTLAKLLEGQETHTLHLHVQGDKEAAEFVDIDVSGAAMHLLVRLLEEMGKGNAVTVVSTQRELTPQQAAAFLGMSRTLLTSLLDRKEIPYRYVGSHKRIRFSDLLAYRAEQERCHQALNELTAQAQELDLAY